MTIFQNATLVLKNVLILLLSHITGQQQNQEAASPKVQISS